MAGSQPEGKPATNAALIDARAYLNRPDPPGAQTALRAAKVFEQARDWKSARRVLQRARQHPDLVPGTEPFLGLFEREALCWSKDSGLPFNRHMTALQILEGDVLNRHRGRKEALGLAGGICKRMWTRSGQMRHLMKALEYYSRGYRSGGLEEDQGYNAINAAFIKDQLAVYDASTARVHCEEARRIREELLRSAWAKGELSEWWPAATVCEALFGLGRYEEAVDRLSKVLKAHRATITEGERSTTVTQLAELCRMHVKLRGYLGPISASVARPDAEPYEDDVIPGSEELEKVFPGVSVANVGNKLGLALSGGGFRASLYHIGVLARLADENLLPRVEVLSCVSGGSIVGAHYYLELRRLLERSSDADIKPDDYVGVVQRVQESFLKGVERNIRTLALASIKQNLRFLFRRSTRTRYLGELIESELYARIEDGHPKGAPRWIDELKIKPMENEIKPMEEPEGFHPRSHNWRRTAKVPVLILNATTLNTGHLWQFTASWMGEPPDSIDRAVDLRERLRRLYYHEAAATTHRKIRLGHAVAASACVPGVFEPFELDGLYPDRKVRLVDGGVFDNQGISGLLAEDCLELIVSDASGLLTAEAQVAASRVRAPLRSNSISMGLIRERQYESVYGRTVAGSVRQLAWIHLEAGVEHGGEVDWIPMDDSGQQVKRGKRKGGRERKTERTMERMIAAIRTDLDSFSEAEAYVLMNRGYHSLGKGLWKQRRPAEPSPADRRRWPFLAVEAIVGVNGDEQDRKRLLELLDAGRHAAFKPFLVVPRLKLAGAVAASVAIAGLGLWSFKHWNDLSQSGAHALAMATPWIILLAVAAYATRAWSPVVESLITLLCLVAWPLIRIHLRFLDPLFVKYGRWHRFDREQPVRPRRWWRRFKSRR